MENPKPMLTLSQVMARLAKKGIVKEFRMNENNEMTFQDSDKPVKASEMKILKSYRFEGESNPSDNAVLYVATDGDGNKGMIMDSYGAESNYPEQFDDFIREIPVEERDEYDFEKHAE